MAITVKELEALRAADKGRFLADGGSLYGTVYVATDGAVSVRFRFQYKLNNTRRTIQVGTWPQAGLAEIRRTRDGLRATIQSGIDPVAQGQADRQQRQEQKDLEQQRRAAALEAERIKIEADRQQAILEQQQRLLTLAAKQARLTIKGLFEQWHRLELVGRADKGTEAFRSFTRDVFPLIGDVAAADVTKAHIQEIVDTVKARATAKNDMVRTAKKTLSDLRQMFGFAMDRDYIEADPTARIKKARIGADAERDRVLSDPELMELLRKLPRAGMAEPSQIALLLHLATIARMGEVLSARWADIDLTNRSWVLPETKNGRRHEIWLSDFTVNLLERLRQSTGLTAWLFPASHTKPGELEFADHVCVKTVTKQVTDRQRTGSPMSGRTKQVDALVLAGGYWTPHDLRRTGATRMAKLGVLGDVIEKCLNHTEPSKIRRIYQREQYTGPMRDAWRVWGEHLELLQAQSRGEAKNVVRLHA